MQTIFFVENQVHYVVNVTHLLDPVSFVFCLFFISLYFCYLN